MGPSLSPLSRGEMYVHCSAENTHKGEGNWIEHPLSNSSITTAGARRMFDVGFLIKILPELMRGLAVTVEATLGGYALALAVGLALALGRRSKVRMIPPLGNYLIGLFKETPLLAAITVIDVFGAANNIAGQTYRYNEPYTAAAIILLAVSLIAVALVRHMERHLAPKSQKRGPVAEG